MKCDELVPQTTGVLKTKEAADSIRSAVEEVFDGYWADESRIDWELFLNEVERYGNCDLGDTMDSDCIKRIRVIVGELRASQ